jgi:hypothetical protein
MISNTERTIGWRTHHHHRFLLGTAASSSRRINSNTGSRFQQLVYRWWWLVVLFGLPRRTAVVCRRIGPVRVRRALLTVHVYRMIGQEAKPCLWLLFLSLNLRCHP